MDRISCVIVDDDTLSREALADQCRSLPYVDVVGSFQSPHSFLETLPTLKFDICLLNLNMISMSGLQVAQQLDGQSIIFIANDEHMLKDALGMSSIDIVLKPIEPDRLKDAMVKAYHQLNGQSSNYCGIDYGIITSWWNIKAHSKISGGREINIL